MPLSFELQQRLDTLTPEARRAVDSAVGSAGLEGIETPEEEYDLLIKVATGELTADQAVAILIKEVHNEYLS